MISIINEGKTDMDIEIQGINLANEIKAFIHKWTPGSSLGRISFVCHSLGGLIARAAIMYLSEYADLFYSFVSLGVPHLGYLNGESNLVNMGLWFLKFWKDSFSLK